MSSLQLHAPLRPDGLSNVMYAVTVDTKTPSGAPELDELHQVGAAALLQEGIGAIDFLKGPDETEVDVDETFVGVYPGGALLKVFVHAPTLEAAEEAGRSLVEEVFERSELLADWTVERCEVELHPDLAKKSLDAADGPEAPPAEVAARRARLAEPSSGTPVDTLFVRLPSRGPRRPRCVPWPPNYGLSGQGCSESSRRRTRTAMRPPVQP